MKQITKYIGMFAALSLVMIALAPNYIGEADAKLIRDKHVVLPEPEPDVDLTIKQVSEPQQSKDIPTKTTKGFVPKSSDSDAVTYRVVYIVSNSGATDVKNVMISVHSDTETVDAELLGWLDEKHSTITALVKAIDPSSITGKIVGFQV